MKRFYAIFDGVIDTMAVIAGIFIFTQILVECWQSLQMKRLSG
jgi:hypothetical protein